MVNYHSRNGLVAASDFVVGIVMRGDGTGD